MNPTMVATPAATAATAVTARSTAEAGWTAHLDGDRIVISLPIVQNVLSKTGKTYVVASTSGIVPTQIKIGGRVVKIGVNAMISAAA